MISEGIPIALPGYRRCEDVAFQIIIGSEIILFILISCKHNVFLAVCFMNNLIFEVTNKHFVHNTKVNCLFF